VPENLRAADVMTDRVRIDKWLWAARFFKTRSLAAKAVEGGRVKLNGERAKPAKELKPGDELVIHVAELEWTVNVRELSERRGPAEAARKLYSEAEASQARRQAAVQMRRLQPAPVREQRGRPTKRDRRLIHRFTGER
jgi:ribosome-associated heat shock protein Hsp15